MEDSRFAGIATDPRFRPLPSRFKKVKIDQRFKGMFTEKKFKVRCTVDERGRPVTLSSNKHLKKFYELSSSDEGDDDDDDDDDDNDDEGEEEEKEIPASSKNDHSFSKSVLCEETTSKLSTQKKGDKPDEDNNIQIASDKDTQLTNKVAKDKKRKRKKTQQEKEPHQSQSESSEDEEMTKEINPSIDYARGIAMMSSSSDDDSDMDEEVKPYDQEAHDDHYWGEQDEDAESTEETTSRLAVQNMDWDRIKANDLFMLFNSFKPTSGTVHSVKIYPSEFGKEKMKEDELKGPQELKKAKLDDDGEGEGKLKHLPEKDQKQVMMENLRQYQLNRLKYYYAVVEFDSPETANHIYTQCDGEEYLASCIQLDLRFIPDGMEFCEEEVKESTNHIPDNYEPKFFINPALGQSLVRCTWDENAPDRYGMLNKKYKAEDLAELDIKAYLASDTDDDGDGAKDSKTTTKKGKNKKEPNTVSAEMAQIASSSDEEEGGPMNEDIQSYRQLLLGSSDNKAEESGGDDEIVDMEITWDTELKDTTEKIIKKKEKKRGKGAVEMSVFDVEREKKRERRKEKKKEAAHGLKDEKRKKKKKTQKSENDEITEEEFMQAFSDDEVPGGFDLLDGEEEKDNGKTRGAKEKKKRKKKRKPEELEEGEEDIGEPDEDLDLLLMNSSSGRKKHFNIKEIAEYETMTKSKRKRKLKKNQLKEIDDDFEIDVKDDRFNALYSSHLYNIDPSSQGYRKTKAMEAIIEEKQRRITNSERTIDKPIKRKSGNNKNQGETISQPKQSKFNISSLVNSVKTKTKLHSKKQSKNM